MIFMMWLIDWYCEQKDIDPDPFSGWQGRLYFLVICAAAFLYCAEVYIIYRTIAILIAGR